MQIPALVSVKATKTFEISLHYEDGVSGVLDMNRLVETYPLFHFFKSHPDNFFHVHKDPYYG